MDPREQSLQEAYQRVSEHFPNVVIVAEAQFVGETGQPQFTQMLRWYGCSTTATGLIVYASDLLCRTFGERPPPPPGTPQPAPQSQKIPTPTPIQEEALNKALEILGTQFVCSVVVAQGEPELVARGERSVKLIRCTGAPTMVAGLAQFAANAMRRMAVDL